MSFVDREIVCVDCSQGFVFTAGEQDFYERKGFKEEPKRCKPCRETRKQRRNDAPVTARAPRPGNGANGHASNGAAAGANGFGFRGTNGGGDDPEAGKDSFGNRAVADVDDDSIGNRASGSGASPARPRPQGVRNGAGNGGGVRAERPRGGERAERPRGGERAERGGERAERRELHDATCATCGAAARVPFKPVPGRPVYCKDCYASRAASAGGR